MEKSEVEKLARDSVRRLKPYVCARDLYKGGKVLLDANENAFGPSVAAAPFGIMLNRYPDSDQNALRIALSKYAGVSQENILIGNGSDEIIDLAMRTFVCEGENIISVEPGYSMYEVCARAAGASTKRVPLNADFQLDSDAILSAADAKTKMIFIVSPNSPIGCEMERNALLKILRNANAIVFVDEAYVEFGGASLAREVKNFPNLIVSRTFSKAWGLAGMRVGYALACRETISLMRRIKPPYNVNSLSAKIALESVSRNLMRMRKNVSEMRRQRESLAKSLRAIGFFVFPSVCNFILVRPPQNSMGASKMQKMLAQNGLIVRDRSSMALVQNTFRITIGTREENAQLLLEIKKLLGLRTNCVLFDMDGVLVDVGKSYREAMRKSASEFLGKKIPTAAVEKIKSLSGFNNDWDATYALVKFMQGREIKPLSAKEKASPLYAQLQGIFQKCYLGKLMRKETPLVRTSTLRALQKRGIKLGIVTGRPKKEAQIAIRRNKWGRFFASKNVIALEDCKKEKPDPAPILLAMKKLGAASPLYIGDSISDVAACKAAGIKCIRIGKGQDGRRLGDFNLQKTDDILKVLA